MVVCSTCNGWVLISNVNNKSLYKAVAQNNGE